jgi:hypothetical protein
MWTFSAVPTWSPAKDDATEGCREIIRFGKDCAAPLDLTFFNSPRSHSGRSWFGYIWHWKTPQLSNPSTSVFVSTLVHVAPANGHGWKGTISPAARVRTAACPLMGPLMWVPDAMRTYSVLQDMAVWSLISLPTLTRGAHFPLTLVAGQDKPGAERPIFTGVSQRLRLPISLEHGLAYGNLQGHPQSLREQPSGPKSRRVKCLSTLQKSGCTLPTANCCFYLSWHGDY